MSQHDLTIENQTFPLTRADLNLALKALSECQSGASEPTYKANGVLWLDTTADPNILKMYNSGAPSNWITIGEFNVASGIFTTARLDGLTATVTELNKLDGVTATTAELNKLAGATATTTQLNYVAGVTSAIQGQLDTLTSNVALKAALASPVLTGTPTAPTAATGTDTTQIASTAFVADSAIGIGQTWQSVTRSVNTSYQNTTGRPIQVSVRTGGNADFQASVNNSTWITLVDAAANDTSPSIIIPASWYYRLNGGSGVSWTELR